MVNVVSIIAVVNTKKESLEVQKWIIETNNLDESEKITGEELSAIAVKLFNKISRHYKNHEKMMVAYGSSSEIRETSNAELQKSQETIEYSLYEGKCLDEENLSYFIPTRTLEKNILSLDKLKKLIIN